MPSQSPSAKKKSVTFDGTAPGAGSSSRRKGSAGGSAGGAASSRRRSGRSAQQPPPPPAECSGCVQLRAGLDEAAGRESALRESNSRLQQEVARLAGELNRLLQWQRLVREKILLNCPEAALLASSSSSGGGEESSSLRAADDPDRPLDCLIWAAQHPPASETRLVDLETRVTQLSADFSSCAGRCLLYEGLLEELLQNRYGVERTHEIIADAFLATGKPMRDAYDREAPKSPRPPSTMSENAQQTVLENRNPAILLEEFERKISLGPLAAFPDRSNVLALKPPVQRLPGCTPIGQMNRDLRQWLCVDLNLERRSGNDWRMLAGRLGFAERVPAWSRLASPMAKLMAEWGRSECATVRMLHRHLSSPEMRSPLLAKRLQEFYRVD